MTTLNGVSAANTSVQSATTAGNPTNATSERNLFMTLLVAQLKNQDPLAPQDGTAFVAQLAQFNSLDQLVGIRQSIDALNAKLTPTKRETA
ncbi:MAG: flagellar hook capping FlgD N-terminal domain-containing protein [Pyrinomonadaceae bacterium]